MTPKVIRVKPQNVVTKSISEISVTDDVPARSKTATIRYLFIAIQGLFSQDYGFAKPEAFAKKVMIKMFALFRGLGVAAAFILSDTLPPPHAFQYYAYIIISMYLSSKYSFCDYQADLFSFDEQLGAGPVYLQNEMIITCVLTLLLKISSTVFSSIQATDFSLFEIVSLSPILSLDCPLIVNIFILYSIFRRLKNLRHVVSEGTNIINYQHFYKMLLDYSAKIKSIFDCFTVVSLGSNIPYAMCYIYGLLKGNIEEPLGFYVVNAVMIAHGFIMNLAPMIVGELVASEAENLKIDLHNKLLKETDPNQAQSMERFIRYIEARPFKYTVYRVIPIDMSATLLFVNICVSYLIVAVQLTHLY